MIVTLTCGRTKQSIKLIAYQVFIADAIYGHQFSFCKVLVKDYKVVVVDVAVYWEVLHECNDILNSLIAEWRAPIFCNWRFCCIFSMLRSIWPLICKPEVILATSIISFFDYMINILDQLVRALNRGVLYITSLDTSARTTSAKRPSVHAVLTSLGPSWAMLALKWAELMWHVGNQWWYRAAESSERHGWMLSP